MRGGNLLGWILGVLLIESSISFYSSLGFASSLGVTGTLGPLVFISPSIPLSEPPDGYFLSFKDFANLSFNIMLFTFFYIKVWLPLWYKIILTSFNLEIII